MSDFGRIVGRSVRTDRYRYTQYTDTKADKVTAETLFDLASDPKETTNVIATAGAETLEPLRELAAAP